MNKPHLGAEQVAEILHRHAAGYSITELARAFGRSRLSISRIVKGETYKQVDADAVAAFAPLPTKRGGGAARIVEQIRQRDEPRVSHAPAPAPTIITHLGSEEQGPRCDVQVLGRRNEYGTLQTLQTLVGMGAEVCALCVQIGLQARQKHFPPSPGGVF